MASVSKREWSHNGEPRQAWVVRYKHGGKHRSRQFDKKKDADRFRTKVETEMEGGAHVARGEGATVRALTADFLKHQEDRMRDGRMGRSSLENYGSAIRNHIVPHLGDRRLHEITPLDVEAWFRLLTREGKAPAGFGPRKGRGLSPRTARGTVNFLSSLFEYAITRGYAKANPCPKARAMVGGIKSSAVRTFSPEDVAALLQAVEHRPRHGHARPHRLLRVVVHIAAFCGLRHGEIFALTRRNVDLSAGILQVRHSLADWDELKGPKTASGVRDVPMPPHLVVMLREWLDRDCLSEPRGLLFRGQNRTTGEQGYMAGATFRKYYWAPLLRRAGLERIGDGFHFHALRHFAASWMIDSGLPITEVASLLGHRKFDVTLQVYAHPIVNGHRRTAVFERMAERLIAAPRVIDGAAVTQELRMAV